MFHLLSKFSFQVYFRIFSFKISVYSFIMFDYFSCFQLNDSVMSYFFLSLSILNLLFAYFEKLYLRNSDHMFYSALHKKLLRYLRNLLNYLEISSFMIVYLANFRIFLTLQKFLQIKQLIFKLTSSLEILVF